MDVMLHKRCAKFIYVIPDGLRELMSDISREVLRSQPEQLYVFIADYLDALMITRENARVAARLVESIIRIGTTTVELLERTGMTREEADRMASIIQTAFKQYMAAKNQPIEFVTDEEEMDEEEDLIAHVMEQYGEYYGDQVTAAEIIQKAFRAFKDRQAQEKKLLTGMIDWRVAARSAIYLYRKTGVTHEEANRAATLIKAAYKGYYTRRVMKRLMEEGQRLYGEDESNVKTDDEIEIDEEVVSETYDWSELHGSYEEEVGYEDETGLRYQTSGDVSDLPDDEVTTIAIAQSVMETLLHDVVPKGSSTENATRAEEIHTELGVTIIESDTTEVPPLELSEDPKQEDMVLTEQVEGIGDEVHTELGATIIESDTAEIPPSELSEDPKQEDVVLTEQVEGIGDEVQIETAPVEELETVPTAPVEETETAPLQEIVTAPIEQAETPADAVPEEQTEPEPLEAIPEGPTDEKGTTDTERTETTEFTETATTAEGETTTE